MSGPPGPVPEQVNCNLCGDDDARTLYVLKDYRLMVDDVEWPVTQCRRCGLGYSILGPSGRKSAGITQTGTSLTADYCKIGTFARPRISPDHRAEC